MTPRYVVSFPDRVSPEQAHAVAEHLKAYPDGPFILPHGATLTMLGATTTSGGSVVVGAVPRWLFAWCLLQSVAVLFLALGALVLSLGR